MQKHNAHLFSSQYTVWCFQKHELILALKFDFCKFQCDKAIQKDVWDSCFLGYKAHELDTGGQQTF